MAEQQKQKLTDEEMIEKKANLFRLISRILMVIAVVIIAVFVYFAMGTRDNISQQTSLDTQEMRSKIKQIVSLQKRYYAENGEYVDFGFMQIVKQLPTYDPAIDGSFEYSFDAETGLAVGRERDASHDVNGDNDGNDGLTLSAEWESGILEGTSGSNFFWPDEDIQDFEIRRSE